MSFTLNTQPVAVDAPDDMPLLWVLRDVLGLTGTKYGCGIALCGACTVHIDGSAARCCVLPVSAVAGKSVTTIEGLAAEGNLHAVQAAWIAEQVPQCGYCQPGMIMAVAAFLKTTPAPDDEAINAAITNICRCGTYPRIRKAIHRAAAALNVDVTPAAPSTDSSA
ncbi:MAG: (2Fe-2S)-binding protein [Gammaproteobacteria bacterium]|nr:(2Fe-2S)-binding protein [Gammaproteobacteria bacterium]